MKLNFEGACVGNFAQMEVAQLVRLPNGDQELMGSTPTFQTQDVVIVV